MEPVATIDGSLDRKPKGGLKEVAATDRKSRSCSPCGISETLRRTRFIHYGSQYWNTIDKAKLLECYEDAQV